MKPKKVLFDTSVLVAGMVSEHPRHQVAFPWLRQAITGEIKGFIGAHTLAELFAVLTRLPLKPKIQPATAWRLIRENIEGHSQIVSLTATDYKKVLQNQAELGLEGAKVYDALIARAAENAAVDILLTLNRKDFDAVWPGGKEKIKEPA